MTAVPKKPFTTAAAVWDWLDKHPPKITRADEKAAADYLASHPREAVSLNAQSMTIALERRFAAIKKAHIEAGTWQEEQRPRFRMTPARIDARRAGGKARAEQRRAEKDVEYKREIKLIWKDVERWEEQTGMYGCISQPRAFRMLTADLGGMKAWAKRRGMSESTLRRLIVRIRKSLPQ